MTHRILFVGGGTAGSVTPLLAIASELRKRWPEADLRFIGTDHGPERTLVESAGLVFTPIPAGKLRRYWSWKNVTDLVHIVRGYLAAGRYIKHWRPQVVVSAGSFVAVPVVWAAHRAGIPTLIHQQDVRPGLANRLMARSATRITTAFQQSTEAFPAAKVQWIGNPVRPEVLAGNASIAHEQFHLPDSKPVLLVLGGGTGAEAINTVMTSLADQVTPHWSVIHSTGASRSPMTVNQSDYHQVTHLSDQLPNVMAAAEVVISRAGLATLSELAALSKPTIFIPIPNSHQEGNANLVATAKAGIVLDQRHQLQSQLAERLERLRQSPDERHQLGAHLHAFYRPDALQRLTEEVVKLATAS